MRGGRRRRRHPRAGAARRGREGVRGRHRHPPVRRLLESGEDGARATRRRSTASSAGSRRCASRRSRWSTASRWAAGSRLSAACDLRVCTPGRALRPPDRPHGRQLPVDGELRPAGRAARRGAAEGHRLHRPRDRGRRGARDRPRHRGRRARRRGARGGAVRAARRPRGGDDAGHQGGAAPAAHAVMPDGDDLVREAYGCEGFRTNVARFLARE